MYRSIMAAVFALVFIPVLASTALMLAANGGSLTFGVVMAVLCFSMMASGVFYGLFRMTRGWEAEAGPEH